MVPVTAPLNVTKAVEVLAHTVWLPRALTVGVGLTVTLKVLTGPLHPLALAVTLTVATTGALPVLVAVKAAMEPVPLVPKPTSTVLVQAKVAPPTLLPKPMAPPVALLHTVTLPRALTVGVGLTVMVV